MKKQHCFMVPMHNEATVIQRTVKSLKAAGVSLNDVFFVDDGCTDTTLTKLREACIASDHILSLYPNVGKTGALISLFETLELENRYEWVNTLDADTLLDVTYMKTLRTQLTTIAATAAALCSKVATLRNSWNLFTSYRSLDYCVSHRIYKKAQGYMNMITVLPGCGATFRTDVFKKLIETTDPSIITEDMDWTIQVHERELGDILYNDKLIVWTQDPNTLESYTKQMHRWFRGAWQVFCKWRMWNPFGNRVNFELGLLVTEGLLFSSAFVVAGLFLLFGLHPHYVAIFFILDVLTFTGVCLWATVMELDIRIIALVIPFYLIRITNCMVFLASFFEIVVFGMHKHYKLQWNKVDRY